MNFGVLVYSDTLDGTNIGDYIQSLAATQYLPRVNSFINRENLDEFVGETTKLIMNGWFTHNPKHWIPSSSILPLFVAFHINASHKDGILTPQGIEYLKKHSPIGCRDYYTTRLLQENGIDAYFSGCLTLTLDKCYKVSDDERTDEIFIVDPVFNLPSFREIFSSIKQTLHAIKVGDLKQALQRNKLLGNIIDKRLLKEATYTHHMIPPNHLSHLERFEMAKNLLERYAKAKLVITSRIHCALPCLALGTPVIFVNAFKDESNKSRLEGLVDLFNRIDLDISTGEFAANFKMDNGKITHRTILSNPVKYEKISDSLKEICNSFII